MKIQITFDLDSEDRRVINSFVGDKGLATYKECKAKINDAVQMHMDDLHESAAMREEDMAAWNRYEDDLG